MTDVWSGYVAAVATNSQKAEDNISTIIQRWVLIHGVPREILCDQAPGFRALLFKAALFGLNCDTTYGLPYECKSTSKAERTNKRLNQSLRLILHDKNPNIGYVCSALNSIKSRATGHSANLLVYGREINTPISLLVTEQESQETYDVKAYQLHKTYKQIIQTQKTHEFRI